MLTSVMQMAAAILAACFVSSAHGNGDVTRTGEWWSEACNLQDTDWRKKACFAYVAGIHDGLAYLGEVSPEKKTICVPTGVTTRQEVEILAKFLRENPSSWHFSIDFLYMAALYAAFPCKDR